MEPLDAAFPSRVPTLALPLPHLLHLVLEGVFVGPDRPEPLSDRDRGEVFVMAWRAALVVERAWDGPPSVPFEAQEWEP